MDRTPDDADASPAPDGTRRREPVRMPWLWGAIGLVVVVGVPLYLPTGSVRPLLGGVPYWLWISIGATLAFSALICWACLRAWNLVEPEEQAAARTEVRP